MWDKPVALSWTAVEGADGTYYHNDITGDSVWEKPEMLAWEQVTVDHSEL